MKERYREKRREERAGGEEEGHRGYRVGEGEVLGQEEEREWFGKEMLRREAKQRREGRGVGRLSREKEEEEKKEVEREWGKKGLA